MEILIKGSAGLTESHHVPTAVGKALIAVNLAAEAKPLPVSCEPTLWRALSPAENPLPIIAYSCPTCKKSGHLGKLDGTAHHFVFRHCCGEESVPYEVQERYKLLWKAHVARTKALERRPKEDQGKRVFFFQQGNKP